MVLEVLSRVRYGPTCCTEGKGRGSVLPPCPQCKVYTFTVCPGCRSSCGHGPNSGRAQWSRRSQVFHAEYPRLDDAVIQCAALQLAWTVQGPQTRSVHVLLLRQRAAIYCHRMESEEPVADVLAIHFGGADAACSAFEDRSAGECTCGAYVVIGRCATVDEVVTTHLLAGYIAETRSAQLLWAHNGHPVRVPNLKPS